MAVNYEDAIAIIGYSGQFTNVSNMQEFWDVLEKGEFVGTRFSKDYLLSTDVDKRIISDPNFVPMGMRFDNADFFDNYFFNISDKQALLMDPQNRLLLQTTWHALEKSGYSNINSKKELKVGVFAGKNPSQHILNYSSDYYSYDNDLSEQLEFEVSNEVDFLANWISYKFGFNGPAVNIQTACSTSFSAIATACQNLLLYYCDMAVVAIGGITSSNDNYGYVYQANNILSQDGVCRPFDYMANGTVPGNGVGTVVLKRYDDALRDKDPIEALILGVGINNDGDNKQDFMAPGILGQTDAIEMAFDRSGVTAEDIDMVETHGTGTILGDPLEFRALSDAFDSYRHSDRQEPCYLGSVKANFGHLFAGAGMVSLFKVLESLKRKTIPPMANFTKLNNNIRLDNRLFSINRLAIPWEAREGKPRRAGISSFGFGGTNTHIIIEEAPSHANKNKNRTQFSESILFCSARSNEKQLDKVHQDFLSLKDTCNIQNISFSSLTGRQHFEFRQGSVLDINGQVILNKNIRSSRPLPSEPIELCFMFGGQGGNLNKKMGRFLYERFPVFKEVIDSAFQYFGREIMEKIWPLNYDESWELSNPQVLQPAIYLYQSALYKLYLALGIHPTCIVGHSLGEIAAAHASGALTFEDGLKLAMIRGEAFSKVPSGIGLMAVIFTSQTELPEMTNSVVISAYNAENVTVVSGLKEEILNYVEKCSSLDIHSVILKTSHAFHNPLLSNFGLTIADDLGFLEHSEKPIIDVYSTLTGDLYSMRFDKIYWESQLYSPTKFWHVTQKVLNKYSNIAFLELSPSAVLSTLLKGFNNQVVTSCFSPDTEESDILNSIASLYELGFVPCEDTLFGGMSKLSKVPLPNYPFEKNNFSLKNHKQTGNLDSYKLQGGFKNKTSAIADISDFSTEILECGGSEELDELKELIVAYWRPHFFQADISFDSDFFALGGTSLSAIQIIEKVNINMGIKLSVVEFMEAKTPSKLAELIVQRVSETE